MLRTLRAVLVLLAFMTALLGGVYPATVWCVGHVVFPYHASGSPLMAGGKIVGSALIGQPFHEDKYFWPRPSGTAVEPYNAMASGSTNTALTDEEWRKKVEIRIARLRQHIKGPKTYPVDLATESASGLDPHISPSSAKIQVPRIAKARHVSEEDIFKLVDQQIELPFAGFWGAERVNVLLLNIALDRLSEKRL